MTFEKRPALSNILVAANLATAMGFLALLSVGVMYRRMLVVPEVSSGHLLDFLAFGMEPPLIVTGVVFSIALTCLLFVFKSGQLGTVAVALSGLPDMMLVVFSVLTIAEVLPWEYVSRPNSVMHVLAAFGCLLAIKIVLAVYLIGTPYYPKAEK